MRYAQQHRAGPAACLYHRPRIADAGWNLRVEAREMITSQQLRALSAGELDLGWRRPGKGEPLAEEVAGMDDPYCLAMAPSRPLAAGEGTLPLQSAAHGPSWALRALASAKEPQQRGCRGKKQGRSQPLAVPMVHEGGQYAVRGAAKEERRTAPRCKPFGEQQQAQARECADSWCLPIPWAAVDALQPPEQQ